MPHSHYQALLGFIVSLNYTDFSAIAHSAVIQLLQEAGVPYEAEGVMLDEYPYTTVVLQITFELVQETGHRNQICLTLVPEGSLIDFRMKTLI